MKKAWFVSLVVAGLLALVATAFAQPPPGGGPGGPGGPGGRGRGGPGGGFGPGGFLGGVAFGSIWLVGNNGTALAIQGTFPPGFSQATLAQIDANTKLMEYADCDVAQIRVGDTITVGGTPRKMRADDVQVGGPVAQFMMPPAMPGGPPAPDPLAPTATGRLTGKVTVAQPLTVDVNGVAIEIETAPKTSVIRQQPLASVEGLKKGQKVMVVGQRDNAGILVARILILDSTASGLQNALGGGMGMGMGLGGPGGRGPGRPGGGPPAPGGPPPPAGAQ
jgi:hypothetical protein